VRALPEAVELTRTILQSLGVGTASEARQPSPQGLA
jgi:hypothetical protein